MDGPKRWFVLFQNRDELRASWWFPGSSAIIDVYRGRMESFELKDIYGVDWYHLLEEDSPPW